MKRLRGICKECKNIEFTFDDGEYICHVKGRLKKPPKTCKYWLYKYDNKLTSIDEDN